jgi:hypothetical protein
MGRSKCGTYIERGKDLLHHNSPLAQLLPEVRDFQPDYILHDALALWGKQFGQILGVPTVCSTTTFVLGTRMWLSAPRENKRQKWLN